jgi:predicted ester cyclase
LLNFDEVVTRKPYRATHRGTFLDTATTGRVVELT